MHGDPFKTAMVLIVEFANGDARVRTHVRACLLAIVAFELGKVAVAK